MEIINLTGSYSFIKQYQSFALKLNNFKDIWLFNCSEACQHSLIRNKIKINQVSKIIITELHIDNISGLLGLLSSLNLISRKKSLHIYAPLGLDQYLELGKKYSCTNFCYSLYFHILTTGLIIEHSHYHLYTFSRYLQFEFIIISKERYGKFNSNKAKTFYLIEGPLYGHLKKGFNFLLPDGFILNGDNFTQDNYLGEKFLFILNKYHTRQSFENSLKSKILQCQII
uniref:Ribonuclease Z n=1 Tax=Inkyuleea mariana TaxID=123988 RepID=A0A4D6X2I2_9FLOR|nr:ribonuclease Z [Inkyuleea mariana]